MDHEALVAFSTGRIKKGISDAGEKNRNFGSVVPDDP
jgi:hypothetical protein